MITRNPWLLMLGSFTLALLLMLLPLPPPLAPLRPPLVMLVLAYWVLEAPERAGLGLAFFMGVITDLAIGTVLGESALRMVVLAFLLDRFRPRFNFWPVWQQVLAIGALLVNDRIVAAIVHVATHAAPIPWMYWSAAAVGALLWIPLFTLLDTLHQGRR